MSDVYDLVLEGLDEVVYKEIAKALAAMTTNNSIGQYNKAKVAGFDEGEFDRLIATADAYGKSTIYCTFEFAAQIAPSNTALWSDEMKNTKWNNG